MVTSCMLSKLVEYTSSELNKNRVTYYRIKPLFLVQELSKILRCCAQHALLLKVLYPSLWFLVEPV